MCLRGLWGGTSGQSTLDDDEQGPRRLSAGECSALKTAGSVMSTPSQHSTTLWLVERRCPLKRETAKINIKIKAKETLLHRQQRRGKHICEFQVLTPGVEHWTANKASTASNFFLPAIQTDSLFPPLTYPNLGRCTLRRFLLGQSSTKHGLYQPIRVSINN